MKEQLLAWVGFQSANYMLSKVTTPGNGKSLLMGKVDTSANELVSCLKVPFNTVKPSSCSLNPGIMVHSQIHDTIMFEIWMYTTWQNNLICTTIYTYGQIHPKQRILDASI